VEQIILVGHLLVALGIIGLIMMQQGKGSDIAAFFASSFGLAMIADSRTAGEDDLGFELPMEAVEVPPAQAFESDLPVGDIPETVFEAGGSDLPTLNSTEGDVIDSGQDLPEG
jgi:preprotein translocase subunit SecG